MKEKLLVPVLSDVLPAAELSQHVRQVFDNLRDCLQIRSYVSKKQRRLNKPESRELPVKCIWNSCVFFLYMRGLARTDMEILATR